MCRFKIFVFLIILVLFNSCSKEKLTKSTIKEKSLELQVQEAYKEGVEALEDGDVLYAAKKFNEAEILFPQASSAPQSALMAAYSYYIQDYYADAIAELNRFIKVYPSHKDLVYVYYLLGISYYEQIVDEKKDLQSILNAKENFDLIVKNYPNTEYAIDSEFKLDLIDDILAAKEMYLGRYYFDRKKWISAINRFREIIDNYDTTIYTQEALHRLVEVHYTIGLIDEAEKYAQLLGYNYQSSQWYENSYSLFDKTYEKKKKNRLRTYKKKSEGFLKKFKTLLGDG
jgi:outer membrane protein assembly factor BamD